MGAVTAADYVVSAEDVAWIRIDDGAAVGTARRAAVNAARGLAFPEPRAGEVGIAVTEAAANLHRYAVDGALLVRVLRVGAEAAVEFVAVDHGPGMSDLAWARDDGHSTGGTLGIGLSAIGRLASQSDTLSVVGKGTVTTATFWTGPPVCPTLDIGGITRPMTGESECGDGWAVRVGADVVSLFLCDGLGHGPLAARAANTALGEFRHDLGTSPAELLSSMHAPLAHTRGVAAAALDVHRHERRLVFAGVGNLQAVVCAGDGSQRMLCQPGIIGHRPARMRTLEVQAPPDALIVLHSDGVSDRWNLASYPPLEKYTALSVAASLLRDSGVRRDDASVLVVRLP